MEHVKIAVMGLQEAKDLQKACEEKGAEIILNHNDQTCTRGCAVTVELHAKEADIPIIQEVYSKNYQKLLEGHQINFDIIDSVYDPSADQATCPACGCQFSTVNTECPDCGLVLG